MKKYLVLCLVIGLLFLVIPQATAFKLLVTDTTIPTLATYLEHTDGLLVVYVNEKVEVHDPDKLRICFLSDAQDYQGISVEELFDKALPPMTGKVVLLVAALNIRTFQWIFLYADVW